MRIVVVGGGIAGFSCAQNLKEKFPHCRITVIDKRRDPFRKYLLSRWLIDKVKDSDFFINWQSLGSKVEFIHGQVDRINLDKKNVYFKGREPLAFDRLVLATGLEAESLNFRGGRKKGVYYLANYLDVRELKEEIKRCRHILVYTSSMFGLEFVSFLARQEEKTISLVYSRALNFIHEQKGFVLKEYLSAKNIGLYANAEIEEVFGEGRIKATKLNSGKILASDILLIDSFLKPSFVDINNVSLDSPESLKETATRYPGVFFACGDISGIKGKESTFFFLNRLQAQRQAWELAGVLCV